MSKEQIILVPKLIKNNEIFKKNQIFICYCCDTPYKKTSLCLKQNKCEFCFFNGFSNKNTIVFTFKHFLTNIKINKDYYFNFIIQIFKKYKFIIHNWENNFFYINIKNINDANTFKNYLELFFDEIFNFLNIEKIFNIKKQIFIETYIKSIISFKEKNKRPFGKKILMPCFENKTLKNLNKREIINSKFILV